MRVGLRCILLLGVIQPLGCARDSSNTPSEPKPASKFVGQSGGVVLLTSGGDKTLVSVEIPEGALADDVKVTIEPLSETKLPDKSAAGASVVQGLTVEIGPSGTVFSKPVKLAFHVGKDEIASTLRLATVVDGAWTALPNPNVDEAQAIVSATTTHFSPFGVIEIACEVDEQCDDNNACTADSCNGAGKCVYSFSFESQACYTGPDGTEGVGQCAAGTQSCKKGGWGSCDDVVPETETCNNLDDDCDGVVDEGCDDGGVTPDAGIDSATPDAALPDLAIDAAPPDMAIDAAQVDAPPLDTAVVDKATTDLEIDKGPLDIGTDAGSCVMDKIGAPCTMQGGECGACGTCLLNDANNGVCTISCTPDDPNTALVNEDTCPNLSVNTCGTIELADGSTLDLCFQTCQPTLGTNTCVTPLACQPQTAGFVGNEAPICLVSGCTKDEDCPVTTGTICDLAVSGSCATGEECVPLSNSGNAGICAEPGLCDLPSGLCGKHGTDKPSAMIGDPCASDRDCGEYMTCEMELDLKTVLGLKDHDAACATDGECCGGCGTDGKCDGTCAVHARNGYCVIRGCAFATATAFSEFSCPAGSSCKAFMCDDHWTCEDAPTSGVCLKICDPMMADSCRGNPGDQYGDYECRAWNNLQISDTPVCDFGHAAPCDFFNNSPTITCAALGVQPNNSQMECRSLATKAKTATENDPSGFCLDITASGP